MSSQFVSSKWRRTAALIRDRRVRAYVPATSIYSYSALRRMLGRYSTVFVKPDKGRHGDGVMRVSRRSGRRGYTLKTARRDRACRSIRELYDALQASRISRQRHLVQRGIRLRRYQGRPFDLRVMVQQNPSRRWEITGILARVAGSRGIVTNCSKGGYVRSMDSVCSGMGIGPRSRRALRGRLHRLGLRTASAMRRRFGGVKELGLDVGLDSAKRPWIIEVNTSPDPFLFLKLGERGTFRKIYRYALHYGKFEPKRKRSKRRHR